MTTDAGVRSFGMRVFFFWDGLLLFSLAYIVSWPHLAVDERVGWILPVGAVAVLFLGAFRYAHHSRKKSERGVGQAAVAAFVAALLLVANLVGERLDGAYAIAIYVPTTVLVIHLLAVSLTLIITHRSGRRAAHQGPHVGALLVFMTGGTAFVVFSVFVF